MKRKTFIYIVIMGMAILFVLGQSMFSAEVSGSSSDGLARIIHSRILELSGREERTVEEIDGIIRKFGHLIEYFFMGTFVIIGLEHLIRKKWLFLAVTLMLTIPIPFFDEFYIQAWSEGRSPLYLDVGIDLLGILLSYMVYGLYWVMGELRRD